MRSEKQLEAWVGSERERKKARENRLRERKQKHGRQITMRKRVGTHGLGHGPGEGAHQGGGEVPVGTPQNLEMSFRLNPTVPQ